MILGPISLAEKDEEQAKITFNDYELNSLKYSEVIIYDKRNCCSFYISLIKRKQPIAFAFCQIKDYNLMIIKISFFAYHFLYIIQPIISSSKKK